MNNERIFNYFAYCIENRAGKWLSDKDRDICKRALYRFKRGCLNLGDCYKTYSDAKLSEYLQCESLCDEYGFEQVCSSIIAHNTYTFSWAALWVDKVPDSLEYVSIYIRYDTAWHSRIIKVCRIPYDCVK